MSTQRSQRLPRPTAERRPAGWQRALRWAAWLTFLGLAIAHSDEASFGGVEFLALAVAIGVSVWCVARPLGGPALELTKAHHVLGEFRPRTNWALVLIGAILVVGGVGATGAIAYDLSSGRATVGDVLTDIGVFIEGWTVEVFTKGFYDAELEKTRAYALVLLLIPGIPLFLSNLTPLRHRRRFRVDEAGAVEVTEDGGWVPLRLREYGVIVADGATIRFEQAEGEKALTLPQRRVFHSENGARLDPRVSTAFFRRRAVLSGFTPDGAAADDTTYEIYERPDEPEGETRTPTTGTRPGAAFTARR